MGRDEKRAPLKTPVWEASIVAAEKVTLVSLAYILGEPTFKQFGRSLYRLRKEEAQLLTLEVRHNLEGSP